MLLPSGILHLDMKSTYADSLGIENYKIVIHNINRKLISINLKELTNNANLRKLRLILKERVIVNKPLIVTWYPDTNNICPSTIAKYLSALGGSVSQRLPEMTIVRRQPKDNAIPKHKFIHHSSSTEIEAITIDDFENDIGAAFLRLPE